MATIGFSPEFSLIPRLLAMMIHSQCGIFLDCFLRPSFLLIIVSPAWKQNFYNNSTMWWRDKVFWHWLTMSDILMFDSWSNRYDNDKPVCGAYAYWRKKLRGKLLLEWKRAVKFKIVSFIEIRVTLEKHCMILSQMLFLYVSFRFHQIYLNLNYWNSSTLNKKGKKEIWKKNCAFLRQFEFVSWTRFVYIHKKRPKDGNLRKSASSF